MHPGVHGDRKEVEKKQKKFRKLEFSSDFGPIVDRQKQYMVHSLNPYETQQARLDSMRAGKANFRFGKTIKDL